MKTIKDVPILMPDGVPVKVGMTIFGLESLNLTTSSTTAKKYPLTYMKKYTGKSRRKITEGKVISVNSTSACRSFTVRSKRGCENTYSVKNACLPDLMFGKLSSIKARKRKLDLEDARGAETRIAAKLEHISDIKEAILEEKQLIKALKAIK